MKEQVLEILNKDNRPFDIYELNDALGLKTVEELQELIKLLNDMENRLEVHRTKKDKYLKFTNSNSKIKLGTIEVNKKGYGFVDTSEEVDVFIPADKINGAINKDRVAIEITGKSDTAPEGKVIRVIDHNLQPQVGEVYHEDGLCLVKLDDSKINAIVELTDEQSKDLVDGHKIIVKLKDRLSTNHYSCDYIGLIGHKNAPGVDITSVLVNMEVPLEFSDETLKEIEDIPNSVDSKEFKSRRDLTEEMIFTIDGDDTRDIDDAVSIKKTKDGYILGVHIAEVSHYVKPGTKLDQDAYKRATSIYPIDRVIPMLPPKLSNGICSLNPNEARLALSCVMTIDKSGNIVNKDIFRSVIKSKKQMTYNCVNQIYNDEGTPEGYEEFVSDLKLLKEAADILRKHRIRRGCIDFDLDESKVLVDEEGNPTDVILRDKGPGQLLIEDCMVAANETIAETVFNEHLPFIYRVHGEPSEEKIKDFVRLTSIFGYDFNDKINNVTPKDIQEIIDQVKTKKEAQILSSILLRCMQKAEYSENNIGHFGLASNCYTHFTSPIRRYPDLIVHRLVKKWILDKEITDENIKYYSQAMPGIALHTSEMERKADDCEREILDMKKAEYMEGHIDEEYEGMISSVVKFGMFVELPNLIEGLVKPDSLGDNYYYDEATFSYRSFNDKRGHRLGDRVKVKVTDANKMEGTIDFDIIENYDKKDIKTYAKK